MPPALAVPNSPNLGQLQRMAAGALQLARLNTNSLEMLKRITFFPKYDIC